MSRNSSHTILLGGIGGDSHSVGLHILRQALTAEGYRVRYLGTQSRLEDFVQLSSLCNVVMISCMDGHACYYLRGFAELRRQLNGHSPLWYLGGNLHIGEGVECERQFLEMGFDRVFSKFVDAASVLELVGADLHGVEPLVDTPELWRQSQRTATYLLGHASDELMELDFFERTRREVLQHWKTGHRATDLRENAEFLARQPSYPRVQQAVNAGARPMLIQPRSGVPLLRDQIKLFKAFASAGVRVLSYQVDSLTRNNNYVRAEEAIRDSVTSGKATINGFPVVNHGVPGLRRVIREVKTPLQTRHSTRDPRLLAEISYAGGVTSFEGGAICYNVPYYKFYPLDESISAWQYVDRLTGLYYEKFGIVLEREFFGTLTATLIPPSLAIVTNLIESLLAVQQGVKCVALGYAEQGHRAQDVAAVRTMRQMTADLMERLGYRDVQINTVFHQYMAAFPESRERAAELIYESAVTAGLSGATRVITKTPAEAITIPTLADNLQGLDLARRGLAAIPETKLDEARVEEECSIIRREVEAIFEQVMYAGGGSIAQGVVESFREGYLDIPFSPSAYNRGEVMTCRDVEGAVRYLSFGNLPFDRELRQFHIDKMQERRRADGLRDSKQNYLLIERDVLRLSRHEYETWPLGS